MHSHLLWHSAHVHSSAHISPPLKHSQYSLRHFDFEQWQPFFFVSDRGLLWCRIASGVRFWIRGEATPSGEPRVDTPGDTGGALAWRDDFGLKLSFCFVSASAPAWRAHNPG